MIIATIDQNSSLTNYAPKLDGTTTLASYANLSGSAFTGPPNVNGLPVLGKDYVTYPAFYSFGRLVELNSALANYSGIEFLVLVVPMPHQHKELCTIKQSPILFILLLK